MALPRPLIRWSVTPCSQPTIPSPAADWYTVIVTRSSALAKSKSIPATSLPIRAVMSEHCRSVGAQNSPDRPYWLYGVATGRPGDAGGLIRASVPDVADSGCGTPGWQRLLMPPISPDWPSEQKPSKPPMSPIPGTEHGPPSGLVADSVRAATTPPGLAGPACPAWWPGWAAKRSRLNSTASRTRATAVLRGTWRSLGILGGSRGVSDAPVRVLAPEQDSAGGRARRAGLSRPPDIPPRTRHVLPPVPGLGPPPAPVPAQAPEPAPPAPWSGSCPASLAARRRSGRS